MSGSKGARHERDLVNILDAHGWETIRAGGSGSGGDHERPDLLVGNGDAVLAIEAKYRGRDEDRAYIQSEKLAGLRQVATAFKAEPIAAAKFGAHNDEPHYGDDDRSGWYARHVDDISVTPSGNLSLKRREMIHDGVPVEVIDTRPEW